MVLPREGEGEVRNVLAGFCLYDRDILGLRDRIQEIRKRNFPRTTLKRNFPG